VPRRWFEWHGRLARVPNEQTAAQRQHMGEPPMPRNPTGWQPVPRNPQSRFSVSRRDELPSAQSDFGGFGETALPRKRCP